MRPFLTCILTLTLALYGTMAYAQVTSGGPSGGDGKILDGTAAGQADVMSSAPVGTEEGLVVRCIGCAGTGGTSQADNSAVANITGMGALYDLTPPAITDGLVGIPRMNSSRQLMVECSVGCSGSTFTDNAAFIFGTTVVTPIAGVLDDTATNVATENSAAIARITAQKALHTNLRNVAGTEIATAATPLRIDPTGTTTQPVSGTVTATGPLTDTELRATPVPVSGTITVTTPVPVSGTVTVTDGAGALNVIVDSGTTAVTQATASSLNAQVQGAGASGAAKAGNPVQVGGVFNTTQPTVTTGQGVEMQSTARGAAIVSTGVDTFNVTVNAALPTGANVIGALSANQSTNVAQINGVTPLMGNGVTGTGSQRVTIASDNTAFSVNVDTFPDNEPINIAQMNGVATTMGNGISGPGVQRVTLASDGTGVVGLAAGSATIGALTANQSVNLAQIAGVATSTGVGVADTGTARVVDVASGTTGVAPPTQASYIGGISSGATGGFLGGVTVCDLSVNVSTTASAQLVTGVSGRKVFICGINLVTALANNVALVEGTGTMCATGIAGVAGGTTAATGWNLAANSGLAQGSGLGVIMQTAAATANLCVLVSTATQLSGSIRYTIY